MSDNTRNTLESLVEYKRGLLRSIAIAIQATNRNDDYSVGLRNGLRLCKAYIDGLEPEYEKCKPSAEPEQKKGKWIEQDAGGGGVFYECSVCKDAFTLIDGTPSDNNYNFCPNCGADMRQREGEQDGKNT